MLWGLWLMGTVGMMLATIGIAEELRLRRTWAVLVAASLAFLFVSTAYCGHIGGFLWWVAGCWVY